MVDCAGLENRFTLTCNGGSNPSLTAMNFRTVQGKKVSPIIHTRNIIKSEPHVETHIGTDYIYCKETFPPIKDDWSRLWLETERTMQIAEVLSKEFPGLRFEIDMDYNEDEYYMSNKLVSAAKGWATSHGYKVNIKPNKQIATRAADHHCK